MFFSSWEPRESDPGTSRRAAHWNHCGCDIYPSTSASHTGTVAVPEELGSKWPLTSLLTSLHSLTSCLCRAYKIIKEVVIVQLIFMALPVPEPPAHPSTGQAPATAQPATGKDDIQRSAPRHGRSWTCIPSVL